MLYKAPCWVCAPEMTDTITAVLKIGGEQAAIEDYTVKTYADTILADDNQPQDLKAPVTAMLNCERTQMEIAEFQTQDVIITSGEEPIDVPVGQIYGADPVNKAKISS